MATLVRTLQKKASRSRLRQSQAEVTSGDRNPKSNPADPASASTSRPTTPNTPNPAGSRGAFWRKTFVPPMPLPESPKPILRCDLTPGTPNPPNAYGTVRFPNGEHPRRQSTLSAKSAASSESAVRRSPPTFRQSYLPPGQEHPRAPSPAGSHSRGNIPVNNTVNDALRPPVQRPAVQRYQTSPAVMNGSGGGARTGSAVPVAPSPSGTYDPLSATGHARDSASFGRRQSMYRPSPPSSPRSAAGQAVRRASHIPTTAPSDMSAGTSTLRHRPPPLQLASAPQRPVSMLSTSGSRRRSSRPSVGSINRTRESITSLSSLKGGRASPSPSNLSPLSPTFPISQLSPNTGLSPNMANVNHSPIMPSPILASPTLSFNQLTLPGAAPPSPETDDPITLTFGCSLVTPTFGPAPPTFAPATPIWAPTTPPMCTEMGTELFTSPSLASTPGGACPWSPEAFVTPSLSRNPSTSYTRVRASHHSGDGSPIPMFKVIPATPAGQAPKAQLMIKELQEEDEQLVSEGKPHARVLDFGESTWKPTESTPSTPLTNEAISFLPGSPFAMKETKLPEERSSHRSSTPTPAKSRAPALCESPKGTTASVPATPPRDPARISRIAKPSAPPKPARNPLRTLYTHHDDGRSISQSLAELATIACDLPPFGEEMTLAAAEAAARLADARAATDLSPKNSPKLPRRSPPCAPPQNPPPPIPTNVAPFFHRGGRGPATPPPTAPQLRSSFSSTTFSGMNGYDTLPPSPEFDAYSYPSLPSLVSANGTLSNFSSSGLLSLKCDSSSSLASTISDDEEGVLAMIHRRSSGRTNSLTPSVDDTLVSPTTPKALHSDINAGLGLGFDFSRDGGSVARKLNLDSPGGSPCTPTFRTGLPLPDSPPLRIHRMSAAAANPNRVAFYGAPSFLVNGSAPSYLEGEGVAPASRSRSNSRSTAGSSSVVSSPALPLHNGLCSLPSSDSRASLGSMLSMTSTEFSDMDYGDDEDQVHTASVVAFQPFAPAKYVVRELPRVPSQEVGVAF